MFTDLCPKPIHSGFEQSEIVMIDGYISVYRNNLDVGVYVLGDPTVNELMLASVLDGLYDSFEDICKYNVFY